MLRIAVLVSGGGTNLQALIDAQSRGEIRNGEIALVLSSRAGVFALERAKNAGIKTCVIEKKEHPFPGNYDRALLEALKREQIDLVVMAGFMTIIGKTLTDQYANRMMNVHPALIPSFCGEGYYGLRVHQAALEKGVKLTGATVHFVNDICDGGPIILQKAVEIREGDTPEKLQKRVMEEAEWVLLPQAVSLFCEGKLKVEEGRVHILP